MKTSSLQRRESRSGVALVIVLGLLAVLTLLAVAFAISMRVERLAARNYADGVRAEQLIQVALAHAMEEVNDSMINHPGPHKVVVYPDWTDRHPGKREAFSSSGKLTGVLTNLTGEASNAVPRAPSLGNVALWDDALAAANANGWVDVTNSPASPRKFGRVTYVVVNSSGLLDANCVGGASRLYSASVAQLDLSGLPEFNGKNPSDFYDIRTNQHVRYETLPELAALNKNNFDMPYGVPTYLFACSYDPDRNVYFETNAVGEPDGLGTPAAALTDKFNVNSLTNWYNPATRLYDKTYKGQSFAVGYFNVLSNIVKRTGISWKSDDVVWNIINWIDKDRIPQSYTNKDATLHSEGGEASPLVNEVALQTVSNKWAFSVELWYPFSGSADAECRDGDFSVQIISQPPLATTNYNVGEMKYGATNEFRVFTSAPLTNRNDAQIKVTVYLNDPSGPIPVDRALTRNGVPPNEFQDWSPKGFFQDVGYSRQVIDPRSNGKINNTTPEPYWRIALPTLGRMNAAVDKDGNPLCDPWMGGLRQGLPIYVKNGPMRNVGELGYIFLSNRENASPALPVEKHFWGTIDLLSYDEGAFLLDHLTTRSTHASTRGLISISSQQDTTDYGVLHTLFQGMSVGYDDAAVSAGQMPVRPDNVQNVIDKIKSETVKRNFVSFQDMFSTKGTDRGDLIAAAFKQCGENAANLAGKTPNDKVREDTFRNVVEMLTFRQNIFTVFMAAQVLAPDETTPVAEKRAVATVCRDAYTGNYFVRSFKWLND